MKKILVTVFITTIMAFAATSFAADLLTKENAEAIALGQTNQKVLETDLDTKWSGIVYEVDLFDGSNVNKITLNAFTGEILQRKSKAIRPERAAALSKVTLTHKDALAVVSERKSQKYLKSSELTTEGGMAVYEIDFVDQYGLEHEAVVDAVNGTLLALTQDEYMPSAPAISVGQAETTALATIAGKILYTEIDRDRNHTKYEVNILSGESVYKVSIDATTGNVLRTKKH